MADQAPPRRVVQAFRHRDVSYVYLACGHVRKGTGRPYRSARVGALFPCVCCGPEFKAAVARLWHQVWGIKE